LSSEDFPALVYPARAIPDLISQDALANLRREQDFACLVRDKKQAVEMMLGHFTSVSAPGMKHSWRKNSEPPNFRQAIVTQVAQEATRDTFISLAGLEEETSSVEIEGDCLAKSGGQSEQFVYLGEIYQHIRGSGVVSNAFEFLL
jgi:hypothetical protein